MIIPDYFFLLFCLSVFSTMNTHISLVIKLKVTLKRFPRYLRNSARTRQFINDFVWTRNTELMHILGDALHQEFLKVPKWLMRSADLKLWYLWVGLLLTREVMEGTRKPRRLQSQSAVDHTFKTALRIKLAVIKNTYIRMTATHKNSSQVMFNNDITLYFKCMS